MGSIKSRWFLLLCIVVLLIHTKTLIPIVTHASVIKLLVSPNISRKDFLYNNVAIPNPPWWLDNNQQFSQCDSYGYQYGHIINGVHEPGAGQPASPLIYPSPFRNVVPCGPMPGQNLGVLVQFYPHAIPEYEWQCTELVKRYLYQAFGAPDNKGNVNGQQVVDAYQNALLMKYLNNATPNQVPQVGDVLSFGTSDPMNAGHTAIVIASNVDSSGNGTLGIMDQNNGNDLQGKGNLYVGNPNGLDPSNPAWHIDTQPGIDPALSWLHPNTIVASPMENGFENILRGVDGMTAHSSSTSDIRDVWAVGNTATTARQTLIEHWNGVQWSVIPNTPNLSMNDNVLNGITVLSPTNIWAVGYYVDNSGVTQTLLLHYNGNDHNTWTVSTLGPGELTAITRVSSTEAWAVGWSDTSPKEEFTFHLIGNTWKSVTDPTVNVVLNAVSASSATNVWAVGESNVGGENTVTLHWTGGPKWTVVPSPNPGSSFNELYGVTAINANTAWAVGRSGTNDVAFAVQWTSKSGWGTPYNFLSGSILQSVESLSATNIWAVGIVGASTFVEHYDGSAWTQITSQDIGYDGLNSVMIDRENGNVWTVGYSQQQAPSQPLIEFFN